MIDVTVEPIGDERSVCATWLVDGVELRHAIRASQEVDIGETIKRLQAWFASGKWEATIDRFAC
jgi:hypothetical protein